MRAAAIRETFLSFFEENGHRRVPSASLVPSTHDPSVLLTTAGMQPFKPYFRGEEQPPAPRLTSAQKCFRTTDIENVGLTKRHLTFFEMLGNFSFGDYFKEGAIDFAHRLSVEGFGFDPELVWVTVFGGDAELGLGPDDEAIELWRAAGVEEQRIVRLGRVDNFWQAGPTGPCGPCSELYLDRGLDFGAAEDRPGDDSERFLEFWNCVFMQYELHGDGSLTDLPARNIDTGLGLDRMAAILQEVDSVFETDQFRPVIALGEELSGSTYGADEETTRALRILADHGRAMTFLLADGVVPSNEDRGYVLRRVMRRAIQQTRPLGIEAELLAPLCGRVIEVMGEAYPELRSERETILGWAAAEEAGFARTLRQGETLLGELIAEAKDSGAVEIPAEAVFRLHDTYGFPSEMTKEMIAPHGLTVDEAAFEDLMERARTVSRAGGGSSGAANGALPSRETAFEFAREAGFQTEFKGYEKTAVDTVLGAVRNGPGGTLLAKLEESPFYPEGGGQISDSGVVKTDGGCGRVAGVYRLGDDQVLALVPESGAIGPGESARAEVDRGARLATEANHTATHLLHAALRERLGDHVRQAGSYVGPDKLRFDFNHGERMSAAELLDVEQRVNGWILDNAHVRAISTTLDEARSLGAMALFGEKYGEIVRMVEIESVSRELCGGTHVASSAEIGLFHLTGETSSASNVRRIEATTGPVSAALFAERNRQVAEISELLRAPESAIVENVRRLADRVKELERRAAEPTTDHSEALLATATAVGGVPVVVEPVEGLDAKALLALSDRVRQKLGAAAVVLGSSTDGRVHLVANVAEEVVARGLEAGDLVKLAAEIVGGGGGGRPTMAQAGGRDPSKLGEALAAARTRIEGVLH